MPPYSIASRQDLVRNAVGDRWIDGRPSLMRLPVGESWFVLEGGRATRLRNGQHTQARWINQTMRPAGGGWTPRVGSNTQPSRPTALCVRRRQFDNPSSHFDTSILSTARHHRKQIRQLVMSYGNQIPMDICIELTIQRPMIPGNSQARPVLFRFGRKRSGI